VGWGVQGLFFVLFFAEWLVSLGKGDGPEPKPTSIRHVTILVFGGGIFGGGFLLRLERFCYAIF